MKDYMFLLSLDIMKKDLEDCIKKLFSFHKRHILYESIWEQTTKLVNTILELKTFDEKEKILSQQKEICDLFETLDKEIERYIIANTCKISPGHMSRLLDIKTKLSFIKLLFCRCTINLRY